VNVVHTLWDRVSGSQPLPPAWVVGLTALVALAVVLNTESWRLTGKVITIAHEGGHVLVTAGAVFAVSYYASSAVQAGFGYLAAWFLLFGGLRPVVELARGSVGSSARRQRWQYRSRLGGSDADQLARLTGAPAGLWITLFMLVALAALVVGAVLLVPPGWHLGWPSARS